jgi:diguanylate cyclase (GGDEF)-like protein/PAS domain S-box-containing protein
MISPEASPTRDELARLHLFRSVDIETVRPHLRGCRVRVVHPGETLIEADRQNDLLYLVLSGTLSVHLRSLDNPPIVVLGPGETVGELSLIDKQPTSAFVVAQTASRVLVLSEQVMWGLVHASHAISLNLLATLSHRLRYDNRLIYQDREQLRRRVGELEIEREALQHSEQRYLTLYDLSPTMFFAVDGKGIVLSANQIGATELGYGVAELVGRPIWQLYPPEDRAVAISQLERCVGDPGQVHRWEARKVRRDGTELWVRQTARAVAGKGRGPSVLVVSEDITESRQRSEQLAYHANHDALTGLVNRRAFEERLEQALAIARAEKVEHALCYLDLDQFKVLNDSCGHVAGDEFLRQVSRALQDVVSKRDTLARIGGDEFGVLLERCQVDQAKRVAYAVLDAIDNLCLTWEGRQFRVGISIGLVPIDHASENVASVLRAADAACYTAKEAGRNRIHVYDRSDREPVQRRVQMDWIDRINHSLEHGCFRLSYQPIVSLTQAGRHETCFEVLLRMQGSDGVEIMPGAFLPAAERFNLSSRIDAWVISHLFSLFTSEPSWVDRVDWCAVNISPPSLSDQPFLEFLLEELRNGPLPPQKICLEIAETSALSNVMAARHFMDSVRELGCRCALDDFGSGWSSLANLKHLPFDFLKMSGNFARSITHSSLDFAIVKAINDVCQAMQSKTVVEAVEDEAVLAALRDPRLRIDYVQGYAIQRPRPLSELFASAPAPATS